MRRLNSKLVMNFISEKGNDQIEKTYVAYTPLENFMCIAIAESYDNETAENSEGLLENVFQNTSGMQTGSFCYIVPVIR